MILLHGKRGEGESKLDGNGDVMVSGHGQWGERGGVIKCSMGDTPCGTVWLELFLFTVGGYDVTNKQHSTMQCSTYRAVLCGWNSFYSLWEGMTSLTNNTVQCNVVHTVQYCVVGTLSIHCGRV